MQGNGELGFQSILYLSKEDATDTTLFRRPNQIVTLHSQTQVFGLPFQLNGLYVSNQRSGLQPSPLLSFSFDAESYREQLLSKRVSTLDNSLAKHRLPQFESLSELDKRRIRRTLGASAEAQAESYQQSVLEEQQKIALLDAEIEGVGRYAKSADDVTLIDSLQTLRGQHISKYLQVSDSLAYLHAETDERYAQALEDFQQHRNSAETLQQQPQQVGQQTNRKQEMGSFSRWLDSDREFQNRLGQQTSTERISNLSSKQMSKAERRLGGIQRLAVGRSVAEYSTFTVQGAPITGADLAYSTGKWYGAIAGSRHLYQTNAIDNSFYTQNIPQNLYIARTGVGLPTEDHIHGLVMYANDKSQDSLPAQQNMVLSTTFGKSFDRIGLQINGEIANSFYSGDKATQNLSGEASEWISQPVGNRNAVATDLAAKVGATYWVNRTLSLRSQIRHIGSGFQTLGNPFLRNDIDGASVGATHTMWQNQIQYSVDGSYDRFQDRERAQSADRYTVSASGSLNKNNWPTVSLAFAYSDFSGGLMRRQDTAQVDFSSSSKMQSYTGVAAIGKTYALAEIPMQSTVQYMGLKQIATDTLYNLSIHQLSLIQFAQLGRKLQAEAEVFMQVFDSTGIRRSSPGIELGVNYQVYPWLAQGVNGSYSQYLDQGSRGIASSTTTVTLKQWLNLFCRFEYHAFSSDLNGGNNVWGIHTGATIRW